MWCCWYSSKWRFAKTAKTRGVSAPFHYAYRHWCGRTTPIIRSITCRGIGAAKETGMNRHHSFFLCLHGSRRRIFNLLSCCDLVGATMFTFFLSCYHDFLRKTVDNVVKKDYNQDNLTVTHVVRTRYAKVVSQRAADGAIVADEIASLPPSPVIRLLVRNK